VKKNGEEVRPQNPHKTQFLFLYTLKAGEVEWGFLKIYYFCRIDSCGRFGPPKKRTPFSPAFMY